MAAPQAKLKGIYRYPVKGLSPESLDGARLEPGQTLPADRMYAIENGPCGFDPAAPDYLPKSQFLMLMRNERLARLDTRYDDATHTPDRSTAKAASWRAAICPPRKDGSRSRRSSAASCRTSCAGRRRCCKPTATASRTSPPRSSRSSTSLRCAAIETVVGVPVHPLRFRGQPVCRGLAGLARVRSARTGNRHRRRKAEGHQADRALRRDQRRSRHRHPRSHDPGDPDEDLRSHGLRHLCAGDCARRHRAGRRDRIKSDQNASGRATCSSGLRSAATPQRHITAAAKIISTAPSR